jgi:hypothetical protein
LSRDSAIRWEDIPEPEAFFSGEPEHPLLPLPSKRQVVGILQAGGVEALRATLDRRRQTILDGEREPLMAPRPKVWRIVSRLLRDPHLKLLVLLGGNRSTKSFFCADAMVRSMLRADEHNAARGYTQPTTFVVGSDSEVNSKETTQALIWHFLPQRMKEMNQQRRAAEKKRGIDVNYTPGDGFADRMLSIGHGVVVRFILYSNDPANFEGAEFGPKAYRDVAWWMDESLTVPWLRMLRRRGRFRPGYGLWSFTPIRGITPAIKDTVGTGKFLATRRAYILPANAELVRGCRPGRVPFLQRGSSREVSVAYLHSDLSPFKSGGKRYAETVAQDCQGKPREYALRIYYGYTEDTVGRAFPTFSDRVHVVPQERAPAIGTNYLFIDPAGDRPFFLLWVRVTANPRRLVIYREWPDVPRYGEWAVQSERQVSRESRKGWDGDPGPAQANLGWGVADYKRQIRRDESFFPKLDEDGQWSERDPYRRALLDRAMSLMLRCESRQWTRAEVAELVARHPRPFREEIALRKIDPRAGRNPMAGEEGGTNLIELFAARQKDSGDDGAPMELLPAYTGRGLDDGFVHVGELLGYRPSEPVCPFVNEPKLYVTAACENTIWMFNHYTGHGGEDGACKDPADLVRYIAQDQELIFLSPDALRTRKGYSY